MEKKKRAMKIPAVITVCILQVIKVLHMHWSIFLCFSVLVTVSHMLSSTHRECARISFKYDRDIVPSNTMEKSLLHWTPTSFVYFHCPWSTRPAFLSDLKGIKWLALQMACNQSIAFCLIYHEYNIQTFSSVTPSPPYRGISKINCCQESDVQIWFQVCCSIAGNPEQKLNTEICELLGRLSHLKNQVVGLWIPKTIAVISDT